MKSFPHRNDEALYVKVLVTSQDYKDAPIKFYITHLAAIQYHIKLNNWNSDEINALIKQDPNNIKN